MHASANMQPACHFSNTYISVWSDSVCGDLMECRGCQELSLRLGKPSTWLARGLSVRLAKPSTMAGAWKVPAVATQASSNPHGTPWPS